MGIFDELGRRVTNAGQKTVQKTKEFSESGLNLSEIKIEDFAESRKKEIINFVY